MNNHMFIINFCLNMFRASFCPSSGEQRPCYCDNQMFIINFCLNMFRASFCPSSGEQRPCCCNNQMFIINFCLMFWASLCPSSGEQRPCYCNNQIIYYQLVSQHVSSIIMPIFRRTKTVCYCIRCTALVLLDVVGSGCGGAAL